MSKRRWMKSMIETAKTEKTNLPFARAHRHAGQKRAA